MTDPYKVLNIPPTATDEEVKRAYREMARKYHPDNYNNNPLADLAQEKMKEINEAYDTINRQRAGGHGVHGGSRAGGGYQGAYEGDAGGTYGQGGYREESASGNEAAFRQVRAAIDRDELSTAEHVLNIITDRGGEWHFLRGVIYCRRGWLEEGLRYLETACRLSPENPEYRQTLERLYSRAQRGYRPEGYPVFTTSCLEGGLCRWVACSYCCFNFCSCCGLSHF